MSERRFVFDTNVTISAAILPRSIPRRALETALGLGALVLSDPILQELVEILGRARFDRYVSHDERGRFLAALVEKAVFPNIGHSFQVCRDPKDDKFLDQRSHPSKTYTIDEARKRLGIDRSE